MSGVRLRETSAGLGRWLELAILSIRVQVRGCVPSLTGEEGEWVQEQMELVAQTLTVQDEGGVCGWVGGCVTVCVCHCGWVCHCVSLWVGVPLCVCVCACMCVDVCAYRACTVNVM